MVDEQGSVKSSVVPRLLGIVAVLAAHFLTFVVLLVVFCSVVPKYVSFFEATYTELPAITLLVIKLSYLVTNYWYLLVLFGMPADGVVVIVLAVFLRKRNWVVSVYSHLILLVAILAMFWVTVALGVPLHAMAGP